jgi:hypothetical protein
MAIDQTALDANYASLQQTLDNQYGTPPPPRGPIGEIATGIKRGALVGLPSLIGGALKYASEPGNALYNAGQGMVSSAEARGQAPDLSLNPEQHGTIVNALASGGEMLAPSVAVPLAVGGAAALAGAAPFTATALAALGGGALFGAEAGQQTLEKGRKAGLPEETAREAARLNAATTVAAQSGMGMIGGQMLGTVGRTLMPMFKSESASLAASTLGELAGTNGVLKPALKATATGMVEGTALNAGQSALSTGIENAYGVDNTTTPGQSALDLLAADAGPDGAHGPARAGLARAERARRQDPHRFACRTRKRPRRSARSSPTRMPRGWPRTIRPRPRRSARTRRTRSTTSWRCRWTAACCRPTSCARPRPPGWTRSRVRWVRCPSAKGPPRRRAKSMRPI